MSVGPEASANVKLVDQYLQFAEDRNLAEASKLLADDVVMEFPGGVTFGSLEEMVQGAKSKYEWVKKKRTHYYEGKEEGGEIVVSIGTLYGVWRDGREFEGIRYIDFFIIRAGLIQKQRVWNDLPLFAPNE